jgi:5'-3' exonuclease
MGIQDLFTVIKKICPEQIQDFHLSQWRGMSYAIDISIFLNKFVKSAGEKLWMNTFFIFLCTLKKHGIKSVCIFDGPNPPPEKKAEQESRKEGSEKAKTRLRRAIEVRDLLLNKYIPKNVQLPEKLQAECQTLLGYYEKKSTELTDEGILEVTTLVNRQKFQRLIDWAEPTDVYDALKDLIERLEKQTSPITNDQREKAWYIVQMMGIPAFQADGEAEALCAYLAIHGYVDAVFSEDTDVLAYGTPWMIALKDYKLSDEKVKAVFLPDLIDALGYNMDEFRDLCILLSCDYNNRVKGYPPSKSGKKCKKPKCIGWVGAVDMINEYRSLENIEPYLEDAGPLIYHRCRELFTPVSELELDELIQIKPYNSKPRLEEISRFLAKERLTVSVEYIEKCWEPALLVFHDGSEESGNFEDDSEDEGPKTSKCYVQLCAECSDGDILQSVNFYVIFRDEDQFNEANDCMFDFYLEIFNTWIDEHCEKGFYIDDTVEAVRILKEKPKNTPILDLSEEKM